MSLFLAPKSHGSSAIGICARCKMKYYLSELKPDPNYPGLMVCGECKDEYDPYRLTPRKPEDISLPFVRKDEDVTDA